jgi:hypothetical protein
LSWAFNHAVYAVVFNTVAVDFAVNAVAVIVIVFSASIAVDAIAFDAVNISLRTTPMSRPGNQHKPKPNSVYSGSARLICSKF